MTTERAAILAAIGAVVVAGALPLAAMFVASVLGSESHGAAYGSLWSSLRPWTLLLRSLAVGAIATGCALAIGWPMGVLFERADLPGRNLFTLVLAVPFVLPTYIQAVAWARVWGHGALDSVPATGLVLGSCFAPLVLLGTRASLRSVDPRLEDASRLCAGWFGTLRGVTLPLALPGTVRTAALVFLLAVGDLAVPTYFGVDVFPTESFTQFAAFHRYGAATALALPLALLPVLVLWLESRLLPQRIASTRAVAGDRDRARLRPSRALLPIVAAIAAVCVALVVLPLAVLVRDALTAGALAEAWQRAGDATLRSLAWAAIGACVLTLVGALLGYAIERRVFRFSRGIDRLSFLLFAMPSTVLGIGLVALWNHQATSWIYATPAVVLLGLLGQLAAVPTRLSASAVAAVPIHLEEAAQLAGARWPRRMLRIVAPLVAPGLVAAWTASFLFCLRDLGISLIVYPPGADPLPVRTYTLMANGPPALVAALCLLMIGAALGPLVVLAASLQRMTAR